MFGVQGKSFQKYSNLHLLNDSFSKSGIMISKNVLLKLCVLLVLALEINSASCKIKLPAVLSDGIILQRNTPLGLNGWAAPNEKVTLVFNGKKYSSKTNKLGQWKIELPPQKAGGPYEMVFRGENVIKVSNVLFGDVWLCSGQSNMVLPMERVKEHYPDEIANADYPEIRHFFIPTLTNLEGPKEDLPSGAWKAAEFRRCAYFLGCCLFLR